MQSQKKDLRPISDEELEIILEKHRTWALHLWGPPGVDVSIREIRALLQEDQDNPEALGEPANLSFSDLRNRDLKRLDLRGADLTGADLSGANLSMTNLDGAHMEDSILKNAICLGVTFRGTDLWHADMQGAHLFHADFSKATLAHADVSGANLRLSNLDNANVAMIRFSKAGLFRTRKPTSFQGIKADSCYGSARFRDYARIQDFVEELTIRGGKDRVFCVMWNVFADCGRTPWNWLFWCILFILAFSCIFDVLGMEHFHFVNQERGLAMNGLTNIYFSVVTFGTLGLGAVTPITNLGAFVVMAEILLGYAMLGGLISVFATWIMRKG